MSIKRNAEIARRQNNARTEFLKLLDAAPSTGKSAREALEVVMASLEALARTRGDREATRRRMEARKKAS